MPLRVKIDGELTPRKVAELVAPFVTEASAGGRLLLDLEEVRWARPLPLVSLAALLEHFRSVPRHLRLVCPKDDDCLQYLASSGFLQALPEVIEVVGSRGLHLRPPSGADTVLAVTRLEEKQDLDQALDIVDTRLDEMLGSGAPDWTRTKGAVLDTLGELCGNIFVHASCETGWVGAQKYFNRHQQRHWVEVGIADAGRGIRSSLGTHYHELADLSEGKVIERAVQEELSRLARPGRSRGTGFYVLKKATQEYDGSFHLRSGAGAVERERHREQLDRHEGLDPWPGTHLGVSITCG